MQNLLALASFLTVITIADPRFLVFSYFLSQSLLISYQRKDLSNMPIKNSIFYFNNSILFFPKYSLSNILYILRCCKYFSISTPTIV